MPLANPYQRYQQTAVKTADRCDILIMTYEALLRWLARADEAIDCANVQDSHNALINCQDLVKSLAGSLDFEKGGEIAENLDALYGFIQDQLVWANVNKDKEAIATVRGLLVPLLDAWRAAVPEARKQGLGM